MPPLAGGVHTHTAAGLWITTVPPPVHTLTHRMGLAPLFKGMREQHATERARFMWNAIRSPRYGVE